MSKLVSDEQWVWVVVQDPGGNEQFLGQKDEEKRVSFIPTFLSKDDAEHGLSALTLEPGHKYEVQAILFEDLCQRAAENGFMLFVANRSGQVIEKIKPESSL